MCVIFVKGSMYMACDMYQVMNEFYSVLMSEHTILFLIYLCIELAK